MPAIQSPIDVAANIYGALLQSYVDQRQQSTQALSPASRSDLKQQLKKKHVNNIFVAMQPQIQNKRTSYYGNTVYNSH